MIPDPEISVLYPTTQDEFIIIATDGLWDVMSSQTAVQYVRTLLLQENLLGNNNNNSNNTLVGSGGYTTTTADISTLGCK